MQEAIKMAKEYDDLALVEAYKESKRCRIVAETFGCSDETVRRALIKYNVPRVKKHPRLVTKQKATEEELRQIVEEYYSTSANINDLAKKYHRSQNTISKAINTFGHGMKYNAINSKKITDQQILDGIAEGLTRTQIANRYGVHVENLARRMSKLGVHAKYALHSNVLLSDCWHYNKTQDDKAKEILPGFRYIETKKSRVRLKCKACGSVIERDKKALSQGGVKCEHCEEVRKSEKDLLDCRISLVRVLSAVAESRTPKQCPICGEVFYSQYSNTVYCSDKCRRRHSNRRKRKRKGSSIRHRCKKYGVFYDPSVTSEKIFARDHYQCKICGLFCIIGDTSWNGYIGPYSPTVDHIVALANGGTHTWNNVQCAHAICNSKKRDLITV